jgi:hypothetical protein
MAMPNTATCYDTVNNYGCKKFNGTGSEQQHFWVQYTFLNDKLACFLIMIFADKVGLLANKAKE